MAEFSELLKTVTARVRPRVWPLSDELAGTNRDLSYLINEGHRPLTSLTGQWMRDEIRKARAEVEAGEVPERGGT